jgi:hypothetical protein
MGGRCRHQQLRASASLLRRAPRRFEAGQPTGVWPQEVFRRSDARSIAATTTNWPPSFVATADTQPTVQAAISTDGSIRGQAFFRSVARLGIQAADALEHAHQMGVVHRDIKPSNLMVESDGRLWLTDFGLATTQNDANLTMSGDLLGTLRYMSPEQVEANHGVLDPAKHYSLE